MKFKHLKSEFERLVNGDEEIITLSDLEGLRDKLEEKKAKFIRKLKKGISLSKRDVVEVKLEELQEMLKQLKAIIANRS
ncbi:hypothetical protein [Leucothrix pacifica]|uniref:50S ribosomal protein L29 n=1 Tax=Leucothrix pacifica TaxID=1247513 RepID=A0A317CPK2_9GAMM|nr:hypothetical protein [Leucothrix pacifica]PWQ99403.1 hypothetical protein DKW60_05820 [Leucothrix pacifica]